MNDTRNLPVLLAHPFRPFFILTGVYGLLVVAAWVAFLFGGLPLPLGWSPIQWHSHEMLYGFVTAATAGFLLTAMTNWTGAKPLQGSGLLALIGLWIAGRVVMWLAGWLPAWLVAVVDLAFLPVLATYVTRVLLASGNRRNLILVAVLVLLTLGNLMMHIGFITGGTRWLQVGQLHGFDVITLMMVIIAGRIVPAFTANWLRMNGGNPEWVKRPAWVDKVTLASVIILLPLDWIGAPNVLIGIAALFAGLINLLRLANWSGWRTLREPLLWILHLAYLWIALAFVLRGVSAFSGAVPATAWQHALGLGGIGMLILGVMTRVAMGHTGRPLQLKKFGLLIYLSILAATVLRLAAALGWMDYRLGVSLAGVGWVIAFLLFLILYAPVLSAPRADGKPG